MAPNCSASALLPKTRRIALRFWRRRTRISSWHQNNYSCSCIAFLTVGNAGIVKSVHHQRFFLFMPSTSALFIGLMSGTSLDGVDGVLAAFPGHPSLGRIDMLSAANISFPEELRTTLMQLQTAGENEIHQEALAANALAKHYAEWGGRGRGRAGGAAGGGAAGGGRGRAGR